MIFKIHNSYHDTVEEVEADSLEQVIAENTEYLKGKAFDMAENELDSDWESFFPTYEVALESTYKNIYNILVNEVSYT